MNVLIFTGQFGMGHQAAAQAIRQELLRQDPAACVTILDVVEDCFPQLRRVVYGWFDFTVNYCAGVYNILNRMAGRCQCAPMKGAMIQKLDQLLGDGRTDLLISTLPLSSQYLSAYKRASGCPIPLYTYITDIQAHQEWIAPETSCYFVGDESTRLQLLRQGVPGDRIAVTGIPVRQAFRFRPRRPAPRRELLVMGGGLGLIPNAQALLSALAEAPDVHVTIITGKNEALRRSLSAAFPAFEVVGRTDQVARYMARADLLLTKAGGITTFEAIHTGTPLCLLRPFLQQEIQNADFVRRRGFGVVLEDKGREPEAILSLLRDRDQLTDIRQRMAVALRSLDRVTALDRYAGERKAVC